MLRTLLAPNPSPMTLDGTRTQLVGRERPVVIDPGPDDPQHLDAIERALGGIVPVAILLTHAHGDHADAAAPLAARTGAPVWIGHGALHPPRGIARWLADGDEVDTDAGPLRAIATPGHAPEHLAFLWDRTLFAGDAFMGGGDTTLVAPPEGDLAAYLRTLDRVGELALDVILPAHGPAIPDPSAAVGRYRAHRHERIAQVAEAIRATGSTTPADILDAVYGPTLHPALRPAAEGSLHAILTYLRNETEAPR
ncbi:MAG TPA: MBL fold metallo-hydrolase [Longimicrobium sp.]|jgi:glyoxylase-like metal-dependent hydrolase (beta-lactamase superfamily II)